MKVIDIVNHPNISDIPILYILRVIHVIQEEENNERPSSFSKELFEFNEQFKE